MAGPACKTILNGGLLALMQSLEHILTRPELHGGLLSFEERRELLDRMAYLDTSHYRGNVSIEQDEQIHSPRGLLDIMLHLINKGVLSDDVWQIYNPHSECKV